MPEDQNTDNNQENNDAGDNSQDDNQDNNDGDNSQDNNDDNIEERDPESFNYDLIVDDQEKNDDSGDSDDDDKDKKPPVKDDSKVVSAFNQMKVDTAVKNGINKFFENNPEAKQYQKMVEKFVNHSERMKFIKGGLPVSAVIAEALAPHQQRIGALKVKAADEVANRSKDGGNNQSHKEPGNKDYSGMSNNDIRKMARDVKNGRYKG